MFRAAGVRVSRVKRGLLFKGNRGERNYIPSSFTTPYLQPNQVSKFKEKIICVCVYACIYNSLLIKQIELASLGKSLAAIQNYAPRVFLHVGQGECALRRCVGGVA